MMPIVQIFDNIFSSYRAGGDDLENIERRINGALEKYRHPHYESFPAVHQKIAEAQTALREISWIREIRSRFHSQKETLEKLTAEWNLNWRTYGVDEKRARTRELKRAAQEIVRTFSEIARNRIFHIYNGSDFDGMQKLADTCKILIVYRQKILDGKYAGDREDFLANCYKIKWQADIEGCIPKEVRKHYHELFEKFRVSLEDFWVQMNQRLSTKTQSDTASSVVVSANVVFGLLNAFVGIGELLGSEMYVPILVAGLDAALYFASQHMAYTDLSKKNTNLPETINADFFARLSKRVGSVENAMRHFINFVDHMKSGAGELAWLKRALLSGACGGAARGIDSSLTCFFKPSGIFSSVLLNLCSVPLYVLPIIVSAIQNKRTMDEASVCPIPEVADRIMAAAPALAPVPAP